MHGPLLNVKYFLCKFLYFWWDVGLLYPSPSDIQANEINEKNNRIFLLSSNLKLFLYLLLLSIIMELCAEVLHGLRVAGDIVKVPDKIFPRLITSVCASLCDLQKSNFSSGMCRILLLNIQVYQNLHRPTSLSQL